MQKMIGRICLTGLFFIAGISQAQAVVSVMDKGDAQGSTISAVTVLNKRIDIHLSNMPLQNALDKIAMLGDVHIIYKANVVSKKPRVSLKGSNLSIQDAFDRVLAETGLELTVQQGQLIVAEKVSGARGALGQGVIAGRVVDLKSGRGISGATVSLGSDIRGTITGENGSYRLSGVAAGTHSITVRLVGFAKQTRTVTVGEGVTVTVDFKLEASANVLDQVVVTGTVAQTELKAVPNAITVITARQIEERGITKIDQLFRGDIPGLFALNQGSNANALLDEVAMFSRGATALAAGSIGGTSISPLTNPIKTYVDGIELADSKYLSQIDPKSIERIEILTGPQASTIYGSNAINGVMQIFTKRGTSTKPQINLSVLSGWVENSFSNSRTPQHDYSSQLNGVEGRISYNVGSSWSYIGAWTPAKQSSRITGTGGARFEMPVSLGSVTADMTLRRSVTRNSEQGGTAQTTTGYREAGWYVNLSNSGLTNPAIRILNGQTVGFVLTHRPTNWWSHEFGMGTDASDTDRQYTARGYTFVSDTTLFLSQGKNSRRSLRYSMTARLAPVSSVQGTVTMGADAWQSLTSSVEVQPQTLTGSLTGTTNISRRPGHNTGGFVQTQLGIKDQLFLTYGLRAEWNPNFGEEAQPNYAPRYGVAYTKNVGVVTAKFRGSYGRSTRPPQPNLKIAQTIEESYGALWSSVSSFILPYYDGVFHRTLANPELAPEHQQGGEGGVELYIGAHSSIIVTRYNQTVDGLIAQPKVDSVRSLAPCVSPCQFNSRDVDGYGYWWQLQNLNIGSIRNQGWEFVGSTNIGPLAMRGTYSWTKSRSIGITPRYVGHVTGPQYQAGATFRNLPEHTWALGMTYANATNMLGINVTGTGQLTNSNDDFFYRSLSSDIRLIQNRQNLNAAFGLPYISFNKSYALADITASHRFSSKVDGVMQIQNLTNNYTNDYWAIFASMGRQAKLGVRIRLQ